MRTLAALSALVVTAACGGSAPVTTVDQDLAAAREYAASAGRALDGTWFSQLGTAALAEMVLALCGMEGSRDAAAAATVATLPAPPGSPEDDAILIEVLVVGAASVCPVPESDSAAAYAAAVATTVAAAGGASIDGTTAVTAGLAACSALDAGTPGDALVAVAATGFGIEAAEEDLLAGALDEAAAITTGAILSAAARYLCPEEQDRVAEYIEGLGG